MYTLISYSFFLHFLLHFLLGHGPEIKGEESALNKIDEYIAHRKLREEQILKILQNNYLNYQFSIQNYNSRIQSVIKTNNGKGVNIFDNQNAEYDDSTLKLISSIEIVDALYGRNISFMIKIAAQNNVLNHLHKLEKDNVVEYYSPDLWSVKLSRIIEKKFN